MTVQYGNGSFEPRTGLREGIKVECYRFKDSIVKDIKDADLVISHAGAGTCLEVNIPCFNFAFLSHSHLVKFCYFPYRCSNGKKS